MMTEKRGGITMTAQFQSPLSNLCDVLGEIKDSAKQYKAILTKNEASTRAVLIDPILRALGWDTANTHMVEIEKSLGSVRADYALFDSNKAAQIIVEAKALGSNLTLQSLVMSLVNYAFEFKLNDVFLTDGLTWYHYSDFRPGKITPTRILDLTKDNPVEIAAYLVQMIDAARFWPVENTDLLVQRIEQLESTVATLQRLISLQTPSQPVNTITISSNGTATNLNTTTTITPPPPTVVLQPTQAKYVDLASLIDVTGKRPSQLRLPDNSTIAVKRWKEVLRECCKYTLTSNPSISFPLPDRAGRKVSLLSLTKPAPGISYVTEQYNGGTIFIYVNYDANNCIANAQYILGFATSTGNITTAAVAIE